MPAITAPRLRSAFVAIVVLFGLTGCIGPYGRFGGVVGGTTYTNTYTQTVATYAGSPSQEVATFAFTQQLTYLLNGGGLFGSNVSVQIANVTAQDSLCFNYTGTVASNFQQYFFAGTVNGLGPGQSTQREVGSNPLRIDSAQITILFTPDSQSVPGTAFCN
ncbi:MAG TPA: hypothetical protein VEJ20_03810 [Candidatus Eremiobacteraceae bacterium]|nr:hypothetical protein [Candidatus Eremiobacteraceae bacterium]